MASSELYNSLFQQVRKLGLPYEIKESAGSVVIKISPDTKHSFRNEREKFRFRTNRTLNGSNNLNWRCPQNYEERSLLSPLFPNLHFFQTTPPPQRLSPSPPPRCLPPSRPTAPPPPPARLPNPTRSTPTLNPYRLQKPKFIFPIPNTVFTPSQTAMSTGTDEPNETILPLRIQLFTLSHLRKLCFQKMLP